MYRQKFKLLTLALVFCLPFSCRDAYEPIIVGFYHFLTDFTVTFKMMGLLLFKLILLLLV